MLHIFDLMFRTALFIAFPFVLMAAIYTALDVFKREQVLPTVNDIAKQIEEDKANA